MTTPNDIAALAARMQEAQAEEQRELLEAAFGVVKGPPLIAWVCVVTGRRDYTSSPDFIRFSAMLDAEAFESASLMLVPEGWAWMTGCWAGEGFFATLSPTDESGIEADMIDTNAQTPALAIASAALLAHVEISRD